MSVLLGLQILGAVHSYSEASKGAAQVREAGEASAQLSELETAETIRRYQYSFEQEQAQRVVAAAKSGVVLEGTPISVMAEAANVAEREVAFMQEQGRRTAAARRKGASVQAQSLQAQGTGLLIQNIADIGTQHNWWSSIS